MSSPIRELFPQESPSPKSHVWSGSDFPYMCLKDVARTSQLMDAVTASVSPGDVVADLGSGTGILALTAAAAGARKVFAVELDAMMAATLRRTVEANGFSSVIEVVEQDVQEVSFPLLDFVSAELIDTALADEMLVAAHNHLVEGGALSDQTRMLFSRYDTFVTPAHISLDFFGFQIKAPRHEWDFYSQSKQWYPQPLTRLSSPVLLGSCRFENKLIDPYMSTEIPLSSLTTDDNVTCNALVLSGEILLSTGQTIKEFNSLNGLKIIPLDDIPDGATSLSVSLVMSGGLHSLSVKACG